MENTTGGPLRCEVADIFSFETVGQQWSTAACEEAPEEPISNP